jgi:hypothetical protein
MSILSYRIVTARTMSRMSILPYRCVTARTMHIHSTRGWYLLGRSNMTNMIEYSLFVTIRAFNRIWQKSRCVTIITMPITFTWWLVPSGKIEYDKHDRILTIRHNPCVQPYLAEITLRNNYYDAYHIYLVVGTFWEDRI